MPTTDPRWLNPRAPWGPEHLAMRLLRDPRDLLFIRVMAVVSAILLPLATFVFLLPPWGVAAVAVPYLAFVFLNFGGRYGLMLHANGHRPIFRREWRFLSNYVPFVLGPFLGHTPTSFAAHHMWMHHAENNMLGDGSSTMPYRRDHFPHFLHYWFRFFAFGHMHLIRYLWLRGRTKTVFRFIGGELFWLGLVAVALWVNWAAALLVFVVPMLMMRWLMMAGNWSQHAFINMDDPDSGWHNSTCLTNTRYNHKCYNDGYHIIHHLKPAMHYTEMAQWYDDHIDQFREHDCLVFDGIADNQAIWFLLMTKNYDKLARHMVELVPRSHEEKVAYLQTRVRTQKGTIPSLFWLESPANVQATSRRGGISTEEALALE